MQNRQTQMPPSGNPPMEAMQAPVQSAVTFDPRQCQKLVWVRRTKKVDQTPEGYELVHWEAPPLPSGVVLRVVATSPDGGEAVWWLTCPGNPAEVRWGDFLARSDVRQLTYQEAEQTIKGWNPDNHMPF